MGTKNEIGLAAWPASSVVDLTEERPLLERWIPNLENALRSWDGGKWLALPSVVVIIFGLIWGIAG